MDTKERHIKENEGHRHDDVNSDLIADSLKANGKNQKRESTKRVNKLWLWLGVLVLVLILLWWLFIYVDIFGITGNPNGELLKAIDPLKMLV